MTKNSTRQTPERKLSSSKKGWTTTLEEKERGKEKREGQIIFSK